jgi:hypothetical protein
MNTYNISFNGITILKNIPEDQVKKHTEDMRNYISMTSSNKTLKDIEGDIRVSINSSEDHCNN